MKIPVTQGPASPSDLPEPDDNFIAMAAAEIYQQENIDSAFDMRPSGQTEALSKALEHANQNNIKGVFSFDGETYSTDGNAIDFASEKQVIDHSNARRR